MTQAFNLSQFANFVDTNGKLTASTGVTGTLLLQMAALDWLRLHLMRC